MQSTSEQPVVYDTRAEVARLNDLLGELLQQMDAGDSAPAWANLMAALERPPTLAAPVNGMEERRW
jgi:hypothetical protein